MTHKAVFAASIAARVFFRGEQGSCLGSRTRMSCSAEVDPVGFGGCVAFSVAGP